MTPRVSPPRVPTSPGRGLGGDDDVLGGGESPGKALPLRGAGHGAERALPAQRAPGGHQTAGCQRRPGRWVPWVGRGWDPPHGCSHPTHPPHLLVEPISVVPNQYLERRRCPLIVGIRGGSQALSCGTGPEPQLKLEEVGLLDLFSRGAEATPYTFYKTFGGSTHTFEAAAFPGHFLSTTQGQGEALSLAPPPAVTSFYLLRK
uniref:Interleukin-1 n=1 Tax=Buteo japonicus TaxID=224669 RepID=A0A8C0BMX4_9AVES